MRTDSEPDDSQAPYDLAARTETRTPAETWLNGECDDDGHEILFAGVAGPSSGGTSRATAVSIRSDGATFIAGDTNQSASGVKVAIWRLESGPELTLGSKGAWSVDGSGDDLARCMDLAADGRMAIGVRQPDSGGTGGFVKYLSSPSGVVVSCPCFTGAGDQDIASVRLLADGSLLAIGADFSVSNSTGAARVCVCTEQGNVIVNKVISSYMRLEGAVLGSGDQWYGIGWDQGNDGKVWLFDKSGNTLSNATGPFSLAVPIHPVQAADSAKS